MLPHCKIIPIQLLHFTCHRFNKLIPICNKSVRLIFNILQLISNFKFKRKNRALQSNYILGRSALIHTEKFKIPTKVKDIELVLIFSIYNPRTKSCSSSNHLPELCFTHNLLKKYKVYHLRYINTCIKHIYRYCNLRHTVRIGKLINSTLCIIRLIINYFGKWLSISCKLRILLIKYFKYFLSMGMAFGKYNCLTNFLPIIHLNSIIHKYIKYLLNGIFIKYPFV